MGVHISAPFHHNLIRNAGVRRSKAASKCLQRGKKQIVAVAKVIDHCGRGQPHPVSNRAHSQMADPAFDAKRRRFACKPPCRFTGQAFNPFQTPDIPGMTDKPRYAQPCARKLHHHAITPRTAGSAKETGS